MKHPIALLWIPFLVLALVACGGQGNGQVQETVAPQPGPTTVAGEEGTPNSTPEQDENPGPTATTEVTETSTAVPSATPRPSATPSATSSPSATPTPAATATSEPTAGPTAASESPPGAGPSAVNLELEAVVDGLDSPVNVVAPGDGSGRLFVLEQPGRVRVVEDSTLLDTPFLDVVDRVTAQGNEQGLLGLAFDPDYADNGIFYLNYTDVNSDTVVSRWSVSDDPNRAEPGSETVILAVDQPAANHNGGHLVFGPDGALWIGLGDGGGAGDTHGNGQNPETLLGAVLRLDVEGEETYAIPEDNPFRDDAGARGEIWAIGLRNPWRYSFDRLTGDLYIADVGQNIYEEVNFQPADSSGGENYGWPIMEGAHCFRDESCSQEGLVAPIWEYDHGLGCSITGGYVYRGERYASLQGIYVVADYCSGTIWGLARDADGNWQSAVLAESEMRITSFGEDEAGELYLVDRAGGLYHLAADD